MQQSCTKWTFCAHSTTQPRAEITTKVFMFRVIKLLNLVNIASNCDKHICVDHVNASWEAWILARRFDYISWEIDTHGKGKKCELVNMRNVQMNLSASLPREKTTMKSKLLHDMMVRDATTHDKWWFPDLYHTITKVPNHLCGVVVVVPRWWYWNSTFLFFFAAFPACSQVGTFICKISHISSLSLSLLKLL